MKIVLTGATGFIGKPLLKKLVSIYGKNVIKIITSGSLEGYDCIFYKSLLLNF